MDWYPQDKKELGKVLDKFMAKKPNIKQKEVHGIIVPHAGYSYSGEIAGKAFSLLKGRKNKKAVILSPSHYILLRKTASHSQEYWKTPLGKIDILDSDFPKINISREHAIDNQIPFLQELGFNEILPILVGEISQSEAKETAEEFSKIDAVFIISTDLSHFLEYKDAVKNDKKTIKAIESLDSQKLLEIENSACGIYPLMVLIELCKIKRWKPKLISYKNSGDIIGEKSSVVGYSSFMF